MIGVSKSVNKSVFFCLQEVNEKRVVVNLDHGQLEVPIGHRGERDTPGLGIFCDHVSKCSFQVPVVLEEQSAVVDCRHTHNWSG